MNTKIKSLIGGYNDDEKYKKPFHRFIFVVILFNSILLGVEAELPDSDYLEYFLLANQICLYIFVLEIILKIFVWKLDFFKDSWNIFDLIIVIICLIPIPILSIFRAVRVLRIFRILSAFKKTRKVISALISSLPSMFS
ncbi:ion transporter, partial [Ursidibacter arcticus]